LAIWPPSKPSAGGTSSARAAKGPLPDGRSSDKIAEEAVGLLKQAVAKGHKDATQMMRDKDLEALRGREDFRKLAKNPAEKN
jgi:hypothetical protein